MVLQNNTQAFRPPTPVGHWISLIVSVFVSVPTGTFRTRISDGGLYDFTTGLIGLVVSAMAAQIWTNTVLPPGIWPPVVAHEVSPFLTSGAPQFGMNWLTGRHPATTAEVNSTPSP